MKNNIDKMTYNNLKGRDLWAHINDFGKGSFRLHWHEFYELEYCYAGTGRHILNGQSYELKPGSLTFLRLTDFHEYRYDSDCRVLDIAFSDSMLSDSLYHKILKVKGNLIVFLDESEMSILEGISSALLYESESERRYRDDALKMMVDYMVITLLRKLEGSETLYDDRNDKYKSLREVMEYINMHFREDPSLEDIAKIAGYSKNYFCKLFASTIGESYSVYLSRVKTKYSKSLLRSTDLSVLEICMSSGFNSLSNFLRTFKRIEGIAPVAYREKYRDTVTCRQESLDESAETRKARREAARSREL